MERIERFPLSDLLSLTLQVPLYLSGGQGPGALMGHMTQGHLNPFNPAKTWASCVNELLRQHTWLRGILLPAWLLESGKPDWAGLWAWLDVMETKHGGWHNVTAMPEEERDCGCGVVIVTSLEDLPPEVQEFFRRMTE